MAVLCRLVSVLYLTKDLGRNMNYITVFSEYFYHYGPKFSPSKLVHLIFCFVLEFKLAACTAFRSDAEQATSSLLNTCT